jgi:hypothetical protein
MGEAVTTVKNNQLLLRLRRGYSGDDQETCIVRHSRRIKVVEDDVLLIPSFL